MHCTVLLNVILHILGLNEVCNYMDITPQEVELNVTSYVGNK